MEKGAESARLNIYVPVASALSIDNIEFVDIAENKIPLAFAPIKEAFTFSAFSMGSDLYNIPENEVDNISKFSMNTKDTKDITDDEKFIRKAYSLLLDKYIYLNPAQMFVFEMGKWAYAYKQYLFALNNNMIGSYTNPNKNMIKNALAMSHIVYLATHGNSDGLWIQEIELDKRGYPTLIYFYTKDTYRLEFKTVDKSKIEKFTYSDVSNIQGDIKLKWLIIAGCSQLDENNVKNWVDSLLRKKRVHGILGYYGSAPGYTRQNDVLATFFTMAGGTSLVDAWKGANQRATPLSSASKNWAVIYHKKYEGDTIDHFDGDSSKEDTIYYMRRDFDTPKEIYAAYYEILIFNLEGNKNMKKYILLSIISLTILMFFIYLFRLWVDIHDIKLIRNSIRSHHLMDSNNINEIQYPDILIDKLRDKVKIPWGINKFELKTLLQEHGNEEIDEYLRFKEDNFTRRYIFNQKEQLFCISEEQFYDLNDHYFYEYMENMEYMVIYKGYILPIEGDIESVTNVSWIDDLGNEQNIAIDTTAGTTDFYNIAKRMDVGLDYENMDASLKDRMFREYNLKIQRLWYYNNSCLEFTTKKYNESKLVSEFTLKNVKLMRED